MVTEDAQVASDLRARLAQSLGQQRFDLWIGEQTRFRVSERHVTVFSPTSFARDWLRRNFSAEIRACCDAVGCRKLEVVFEVDDAVGAIPASKSKCLQGANGAASPAQSNGVKQAESACSKPPAVGAKQVGSHENKAAAKCGGSDPTFASFVVGKCNEYAVSAAMMTERGLQQASPLLFWGPTSVGKTHLLRALRSGFLRHHPRARAVYLTAEQFTTSFVEALRGTGMPSFRQKCRGADLLLLDDLQFFAGKRASLNELLHTLDTLQSDGRRIVLASDRNLSELRAMGKELVSRLSGGLVCEIQLPDYPTRLEITRRLAREMGIEIGDEVASLVAGQITAGARELRGALHRLHAVGAARGKPITPQLAATELAEFAQQSARNVRLTDVERAVCDVFGVEPSELRSGRRGRSVNEPRMLAMWLARKYTRAAWSEIGQYFGRRSHSTVIAAHRRVDQLVQSQAVIGVSRDVCAIDEAIRRVEAALRTA